MIIVLLVSLIFLFSSHDSLAIVSTCPNCLDVYCEPALQSQNNNSISSIDIGSTIMTSDGCSCPCSTNPISTTTPQPTCMPIPNCYYRDPPCTVRPEFENQYCPANTPTPQSDCIPLPECLYNDIPCLVPPSELPYCPINNPSPTICPPISPPYIDTCPHIKFGDFDCDGKVTVLDFSAFYSIFVQNFDRIF